MLDHMTFRVTDIACAKAFYSAALAPLGYSVCFEGHYGANILGFAYPDAQEPDGKKADVWFIDGPPPPVAATCLTSVARQALRWTVLKPHARSRS